MGNKSGKLADHVEMAKKTRVLSLVGKDLKEVCSRYWRLSLLDDDVFCSAFLNFLFNYINTVIPATSSYYQNYYANII